MISLKPCPFCGEPEDGPQSLGMYEGYYTDQERVECNACGARVEGDDGTEESAIAKWNRRAPREELTEYIEAQRRWSLATFGEGHRTKSITNHIRKELGEIEANPLFLEEWADVIILGIDGAWRTGASPEAIIAALVRKQSVNRGRRWIIPEDDEAPTEHDRTRVPEHDAYAAAERLKALIFARLHTPPNRLNCPRAKSEMTPCVARDGQMAVAGVVCVGCGEAIAALLDTEQQRSAPTKEEKTHEHRD